MSFHAITSFLASVPPAAIAGVIALIYAFVAGGRWQWPMVLDAGLLGLYLWKPYLGMLLFVFFVGSVRHIPAFAREVVVLFGLQKYEGWTIQLVIFALPALRAYTSASAAEERAAEELPPVVTGDTTALPQPIRPEAELPLLLGGGLKLLNADPTAPHVGIIGSTQLGKTTFVGVLLSYRPGQLVITTPKGAKFDPWFGAEVVRTAMDMAKGIIDWSPIERAIGQVHYEMLRRNTAGTSTVTQLTLVIDELTTTIAQIPAVAQKVIDIITMGAGSGVRLVAIATDVNVKGWKMDGRRDVLDNLIFAKVEDGRKWSIGRLDPNWRLIAPRGLDTAQVQGLAARVSLAGRGWRGVAAPDPTAPADPLLGGLLAAGVPAGVRVPGAGVGGAAPDPAPQTNKQTQTHANEAEQRIAMYMTWRAAGIKREQARLIRQGSGAGLDDTEWAEAGKRLGV